MSFYSGVTEKSYPTLQELYDEEANGFVVTAVMVREDRAWPWTHGPFDTEEEAKKFAAKLRRKMKKDDDKYPGTTYSVYVRPMWKTAL